MAKPQKENGSAPLETHTINGYMIIGWQIHVLESNICNTTKLIKRPRNHLDLEQNGTIKY